MRIYVHPITTCLSFGTFDPVEILKLNFLCLAWKLQSPHSMTFSQHASVPPDSQMPVLVPSFSPTTNDAISHAAPAPVPFRDISRAGDTIRSRAIYPSPAPHESTSLQAGRVGRRKMGRGQVKGQPAGRVRGRGIDIHFLGGQGRSELWLRRSTNSIACPAIPEPTAEYGAARAEQLIV